MTHDEQEASSASLGRPDVARQLHDFVLRRPLYEQLQPRVTDLLREVLTDRGLRVHTIAARVKDTDSLEHKLRRHEPPYASLDEVTDLLGARIITYFQDDVDAIARVIEAEFHIDRANSVDRRAVIEPDRFGYLSLHYVVTLTPRRCALPEWRRFSGLTFEIQVRSIVQHAWAEIEHDSGYHLNLPAPVRRRFSRLAGLLELADAEFMGLREQVAAYQASLIESIQSDPAGTPLTPQSILEYTLTSPLVATLDEAIADQQRGQLEDVDASYLTKRADDLSWLGLNTIALVDDQLRVRQDQLLRFVPHWFPHQVNPEVPRGAAIWFLFLVLAAERSPHGDRVPLPDRFATWTPRMHRQLRAAYAASLPPGGTDTPTSRVPSRPSRSP